MNNDYSVTINGIRLLSAKEFDSIDKSIIPDVKCNWWLKDYYDNNWDYLNLYTGVVPRDNPNTVLSFGITRSCRLRPVLEVELTGFEIGDKFKAIGDTWTVVSENLALCDRALPAECPFWDTTNHYKNHAAPNDYKTSGARMEVEGWFRSGLFWKQSEIDWA